MTATLIRQLILMALLMTQNSDLESRARKVVTVFLSGDVEAAAALFQSPPPVAVLKQGHDALVAQLGKFDAVTGVRFDTGQGLQIGIVSCAFERGSAELAATFNPAGELAGLRLFSLTPKAYPWTPPAYADAQTFSESELKLGSAPWELPAILTLPKAAGRVPGVVLVQGSGPGDEDETVEANKPFKDLAWGLASNGIAVLRYKKRTAVYGRQMASLNITVMDETIDDARIAMDLLAKTAGIDDKRIYVIGHSLGGMLGPRIVAGTGAAGLVIMAGNTRPLEDLIVEQFEYLKSQGLASQETVDAMRETRKSIKGYLEPSTRVLVAGATTSGSYWLDLRSYDPAKAAASLKIPMYILQGERDYQVSKPDYEGWVNALKGRPAVKFKSYTQLNHLFVAGSGPAGPKEYATPGHVDAEVIRDISAWINAAKR
jgi:fermentation-respiration switch protein FrsA (DUF1100 family)